MTDEDAFLRKLLDNPADDVVRLVYADWLEERDRAAKAEFLRLEAVAEPDAKRLQALAADLDTKWLAVVSKLMIERCGQPRQIWAFQSRRITAHLRRTQTSEAPPQFEFECPKRWEKLKFTANPKVRHCEGCREHVFYCDTIQVARAHALRGRCVAVDLGIIRENGDLERPPRKMGKMLPEQYERRAAHMQEAQKFDPVSEKREREKQPPEDSV
ncbi:TIGR02996 domain-containing protein [Limnoglobus roseus]|uniref:TIGR02996 domain-containing protein n=1 Tax=Limnoglobus roseus TaxID=2598579 RepID=A0A5C1A7W6_9BACT|nr:TIGR02996 domain-containing protein [Limnoglobus roseus]QEL13214.1 TIGR02996 domain-containing protein [Limnoglobus roseus]